MADIPVVGRTYKDVMLDSDTYGELFLCVDLIDLGVLKGIDYQMKHLKTNQISRYEEFDWELVVE